MRRTALTFGILILAAGCDSPTEAPTEPVPLELEQLPFDPYVDAVTRCLSALLESGEPIDEDDVERCFQEPAG